MSQARRVIVSIDRIVLSESMVAEAGLTNDRAQILAAVESEIIGGLQAHGALDNLRPSAHARVDAGTFAFGDSVGQAIGAATLGAVGAAGSSAKTGEVAR